MATTCGCAIANCSICGMNWHEMCCERNKEPIIKSHEWFQPAANQNEYTKGFYAGRNYEMNRWAEWLRNKAEGGQVDVEAFIEFMKGQENV